jgi:hypothetical protein
MLRKISAALLSALALTGTGAWEEPSLRGTDRSRSLVVDDSWYTVSLASERPVLDWTGALAGPEEEGELTVPASSSGGFRIRKRRR